MFILSKYINTKGVMKLDKYEINAFRKKYF